MVVVVRPVIREGTLAQRPAASAVRVGDPFVVTDGPEGRTLYRSNGATWNKIAPGVIGSGAGPFDPLGSAAAAESAAKMYADHILWSSYDLPGPNDDSDAGFYEGSGWLMPYPVMRLFVCTNADVGAAKWWPVTSTHTDGVNPGSTDDIDHGYANGMIWLNYYTNELFVCNDQTPGNAHWAHVNPSTDSTFLHQQQVPSAVWTINHNLGKEPSVTVIDSAEQEVQGDVTYPTINQVVITFSAPFGGRARLN